MKHDDMKMHNHEMGEMDMHDMHDMDHDHGDMMMHGGHMMHMGNLKQKFWVSLVATIPIIILSPFMGIKLPFQTTFPGSDWLVLLLATFLFFYGGAPFLKGAKGELAEKNPAMMTLIAMGITVSYGYSLYAFIANHFLATQTHVMDFFWELATLIVIMLLGHWIEMNAVMSAGSAMEKMAALLPGQAQVLDQDGQQHAVDLKDLQEGQTVLVAAGEKVPADGLVVNGQSQVNESLVTGEAKAVAKKTGDQVIGGTVNGDGTLTVKVTGTGESGYLAQVMKLIKQAQQEKSKVEGLADKVAKYLFYAALVAGIIAFISWFFLADLNTAFERMVTVFIIACPHALGLAIPLVVARSTAIAATNGLLIRNRQAIEVADQITMVLMDKTGTLTQGAFKVNAVQSTGEMSKTQLMAYMGALERHSSHPLATGILAYNDAEKITMPQAENVQTIQGIGLTGAIEGQTYQIVTADYLQEKQIAFDTATFETLAAKGNSISYLIQNQTVLGLVAQGDQLKPEALAFIKALKKRHIQPVMLTGDNQQVAEKVAQQLGGMTVQANLKPEDKEALVQDYQAKGEVVLMVGDGVNDAPSLMRADIGIAIGAGTDVAIDSADVILVKSNPNDIMHFLNLAHATSRKMTQNLWWGAGYNILAIPLAGGLFAAWGLILSPAIGAILMSLSTIVVAINAMTLKLKN
ncbi:heavy metal translocating P-type ATPase [Latilactobacillus sakei]|uniref:heavy metal translocating P-type ATPase n=1 Tax=Latilactobacillus sakei TaxID=1599 RepID=UPI00388B6DAC